MKPIYPLFILLLTISSFFAACGSDNSPKKEIKLEEGSWRAVMQLQGQQLPFNLDIEKTESGQYIFYLINADERLKLDEVYWKGDSLNIPLYIFDASLRLKRLDPNHLSGYYIKHDADNYQLPIEARPGKGRFEVDGEAQNLSGKWEMQIVDREGKNTKAVGVFETQANGKLTGSILTATGDYRFLEGTVANNKLFLSTFDGAHAYLMQADIEPETQAIENGEFWSGKGGFYTFSGQKNEQASLADPDKLTYLKEGYERLDFRFPNLEGEMVGLTDPRFLDKVVIVQLFGTWCPNCMDETLFLADWYKENSSRGVEIVGLAYEAKDDFDYAVKRVQRMIDKMKPGYPFLIAGTNDKEEAAKTLPMLNQVVAFPTMIILDRKGNIAYIHTGFSGPGTGVYYQDFVTSFNTKMDRLLSE